MSTTPSKPSRRWARRGFLKTVGASALGTAAVVFGTPGQASATYKYECCNLMFRPSITYSQCRNSYDNYIWSCSAGGCRTCSCCEAKTPYGSTWASAYTCGNYC